MYHRIILFLLALTGLSVNCNADSQCELAWVDFSNQPSIPDTFTLNCKMDSSDFSIKGIGWPCTTSKAVHVLGKPEKKTTTAIDDNGFKYNQNRWFYNGFHLIFDEKNDSSFDSNTIHTLVITSNKARTKRGVTIGDSLGKVFSIYGRPDQLESQYHKFIYFSVDSIRCLIFYHNDTLIERITMGYYDWY